MVPAYLKPIARELKVKGGKTTMALVCDCGSELFWIYENKLTSEEKKQMAPYERALHESLSGGYASFCTKDEDGTLHHWKLLEEPPLWTPIEKWKAVEVFIPETPAFANVMSIRVECSCCGIIHTVFDNRIHGYDGVFCSESADLTYVPHYKKRETRDKLHRKIEIVTENDETIEAFRENTAIDCDEASYSNAFGWICVYAIDEKGKKSKVLDFETA